MSDKVTTNKQYIIFDIDSTSIGGGVFRFGYDANNNHIQTTELFSVRKNITNGKKYPFDYFFKQTLKTLEQVAQDVYLQSHISIHGFYCNIGTPWMSAQKQIVTYTSKKPFTFTQEFADSLIEKEFQVSFKKNKNYAKHQVELIDRRTIDVYGNGYPTRNPIGKKMSDVHIHSLVSVMSTSTKKAFSEVFEKVFHQEVIYLSNTFLSYQTLYSHSEQTDNAIIIDVSGEVTELLVVQKDHLTHIGSIPIGSNGIIRHLAENLKVPYGKAQSIISLYQQQKLDTTYEDNIQNQLHDSFRLWFKEFFNACDSYAKEGLLPHVIILRSSKATSLWLEYMILNEDSLREHIHTKGRIYLQHMDSFFIDKAEEHEDLELNVVAGFISGYLNHNGSTKTN